VKSEKLKIINDPIYGFIQVPYESVFLLIEHPYFQRLRRIRQLGLTHLVYPGAHHTRFHHALGAMHLMSEALEVLKKKGHIILEEEAEAAIIAILLHDIGHGPYSHALEDSLFSSITHEEISGMFMEKLNNDLSGRLTTAISIFRNQYPKKFLHQLVSGQLDMDRLDYLNRDSFFTGVSEGVISSDRIIKMLEIHHDQLAIEAKGIYSIEKFIIARRLMYWQVYLHKTVVSAEMLLINILRRAKELVRSGHSLFSTPALNKFLQRSYLIEDLKNDSQLLNDFAALDDSDISASVKVWSYDTDKILSNLCSRIINRKLFKIIVQNKQFDAAFIDEKKKSIAKANNLSESEADYFFYHGSLTNNAYNSESDKINILFKDGTVCDIADAADTLNIKSLSKPVEKFFVCFPSK
jgi:HD superfamily phosphohydrolase